MSMTGVLAAVMCAVIDAAASTARGQQPNPPSAALDHTVRDGAPSGVSSLAQSADGTLWLGTMTGLYRFDGVRFEPFDSPASQSIPSLLIAQLLALPDTTLWIGYSIGGVSSLAHGRVVS